MPLRGIPGVRGIYTEDIDEEYRAGMAPLESIGNRYVLAAEAPMEFAIGVLLQKKGPCTLPGAAFIE